MPDIDPSIGLTEEEAKIYKVLNERNKEYMPRAEIVARLEYLDLAMRSCYGISCEEHDRISVHLDSIFEILKEE